MTYIWLSEKGGGGGAGVLPDLLDHQKPWKGNLLGLHPLGGRLRTSAKTKGEAGHVENSLFNLYFEWVMCIL
jgi:hypothetical protein